MGSNVFAGIDLRMPAHVESDGAMFEEDHGTPTNINDELDGEIEERKF